MNKKSILSISAVMLLFITTNAIADTVVENKTIRSMRMGWGGGAVYITVNESFTPVEGCAGTTFQLQDLGTNNFGANLSIALSAFHTNSKVLLYVSGCIANDIHLRAIGISK